MVNFEILNIILLVTSLIVGFLSIYTLLIRRSAIHILYSGLMFSVFLYCFGYAFEITAQTVENIKFWLCVEYIGIPFFPSVFLLFTLHFSGYERWIKPIVIAPLLTISALTMLFQLTNIGNLFYINYNTEIINDHIVSNFAKGPWYWIHQIYSNIAILVSAVLFIAMAIKERDLNRQRAMIFILSTIVPWISYIAYLTGNSPHGLDITPFSFVFSGIVGAVGIFRFQLFDIEPLALSSVFRSMPDGVIIIDKQKRILQYNPAAKEIIPHLFSDTVGRKIEKVLDNYAQLLDLVENPDLTEKEVSISFNNIPRYYKVSVVRIPTSGTVYKGWAVILTDITANKLAEAELVRQAQQLRELNTTKDKFFTIIAHDLRNPFNVMLNLSDMIKVDIEQNKMNSASQLAQLLNETTRNTYQLLHNLLDWAVMQRKGIQLNRLSLPLNRLIIEELNSVDAIKNEKEISINIQIDNTLQIFADEHMLRTIIRNLVNNAIKYSYKKGEVNIVAAKNDHEIVISISDHGVGMSVEEQTMLFKLENTVSKKGTAAEKGTGLGLHLCYEFIMAHKGRIWIESNLSYGSTFYISFPLH